MKKPAILSCGEVLWDLFPDGERFGGAPANFACHAAILGGDVTMLSAVGDDRHGREAMHILRLNGIDVGLLQTISDAPTGTVGIELDTKGKPTFTIHEGSAWDHLAWTEELESHIQQLDAIYFGTLGQRGEQSRATIHRALNLAKTNNVYRVLDVNLRKPFFDDALIREAITQANVLKLSDDELPTVAVACSIVTAVEPEATLRSLLGRFDLDFVVMTRGAAGALLVTPDVTVDQPGIPTEVIDTVGAGDAFTAAFLLGLLRGEPHAKNLHKACSIASVTCSHSGAVPGTRSEVTASVNR